MLYKNKKNYYTITNPIQFTLVYTCHTPDLRDSRTDKGEEFDQVCKASALKVIA